jgi:hypothetical protein
MSGAHSFEGGRQGGANDDFELSAQSFGEGGICECVFIGVVSVVSLEK